MGTEFRDCIEIYKYLTIDWDATTIFVMANNGLRLRNRAVKSYFAYKFLWFTAEMCWKFLIYLIVWEVLFL